jgi:hypothetical protein
MKIGNPLNFQNKSLTQQSEIHMWRDLEQLGIPNIYFLCTATSTGRAACYLESKA